MMLVKQKNILGFLAFGLLFGCENPDHITPRTFLRHKQSGSPTIYPYGGIEGGRWIPGRYPTKAVSGLRFEKALFENARFDSIADFRASTFDSSAYFGGAQFEKLAKFGLAHFKERAEFSGAHFVDDVYFYFSLYKDDGSELFLGSTEFKEHAAFNDVYFGGRANFDQTIFYRTASFDNARFRGQASFRNVSFKEASFLAAYFESLADFRDIKVDGYMDFNDAHIDSINFENATISAILVLGSPNAPKFNFSRTIFLKGSAVVLTDLVDLTIHPEKFRIVYLDPGKSYFQKKNIIEYLKSNSFKSDKSAQFELDYIFARSTIYQMESDTFEDNKWYEIWKWPKWVANTIYYSTMGFGYRPFRLIWWALGMILIYAGFFVKKFPGRINAYIATNYNSDQDSKSNKVEKEKHLTFGETLINCVYFSIMVFFTFRLKGNILTFFDIHEKRWIISEWLLGFGVYVAFLLGSKSGSILYSLKELFVG